VTVRALLVGGPRDGETTVLPSASPVVDVAICRPARVDWSTPDPCPIGPAFERRSYRLEDRGPDWAVYRFESSERDLQKAGDKLAEVVGRYFSPGGPPDVRAALDGYRWESSARTPVPTSAPVRPRLDRPVAVVVAGTYRDGERWARRHGYRLVSPRRFFVVTPLAEGRMLRGLQAGDVDIVWLESSAPFSFPVGLMDELSRMEALGARRWAQSPNGEVRHAL
jgi:hypothetical protein